MNRRALKQAEIIFTEGFSAVMKEKEEEVDDSLKEAAFPAYAHTNPLIRHIMWRRLAITIEHLLRSGHQRILDFGCGSGVAAYLLAQAGKEVTAFDLEYGPLRMLQKHVEFPDNITWLPSQQSTLAEIREPFDSIIALDVLEHMSDLETSLQLFRKIINKEDNEVIVSGPTETLVYRAGRYLAGKHFSGEYHQSDIYTIKKKFAEIAPVKTLAKLYQPAPLFEIFTAKL